ncbi:MAG: M67 family metallopeptidase [Kiritimatiellaeota bacterium]|nr:M67 family metallopeptidase [Kiritimatiellota bacterium]
MRVSIPRKVFEQLLDAARTHAPNEACGLLAGRDGIVQKFYPMTNADASPDHYSMRPEEQFRAVKEIRRCGLQVIGIWHSHPASPARMSDEDLRLAYTPGVAYVILSLRPGPDRAALCAYRVDAGKPSAIPVEVLD